MDETVKKWEILGFIFVSLVGSIFHFVFEWSGYNIIVASFTAVNESVWEHLKLAYFPLLIFSLIEYNYVKDKTENYILAKTIAAYIMPTTIVLIFYTFEAIYGTHLFIVDISSFFIAVALGYYVNYKILGLEEKPKAYLIISWIAIITLGVLFVIFTYYPPKLPIFYDFSNGKYGIVEHP